MIALILAIGFSAPKPSALFDACVAAHRNLKTFSVHIEASKKVPDKTETFQYDLAVKGKDALLRVRQPGSGIVDRSDKSFMLRGAKIVGYDAVADEWLRRNGKATDSIALRLSSTLGDLDDSIKLMLDQGVMTKFFAGFRGFRDWKVSVAGDTTTIKRSARGDVTTFRFVGSKPLLKEVLIQLKDKTLHWSFSYRRTAHIAPDIPKDARYVTSFTVREAPPKYDSPETKAVVERMIKAYGLLSRGTIAVKSDDEGNSKLILAGRQLREEHAKFVWAFDGSVLTLRNARTGKFYRGKAIRVILAEYITRIGGSVDPIVRRIVAHRVPYLDLFPASATVKMPGSTVVDGRPADIIDVKTPSLRVSLFVRKDNHLLASMESETFDQIRKVQTRKTRHFEYSNLGSSPGSGSFKLNPGKAKVLPLPTLKEITAAVNR